MNLILFEPGAFVLPSDDGRYRHLKEILKKGKGDTFSAGIVNGMKGTAYIEAMDGKECVCRFEPQTESPPLFDLTLIIGMVRPITARRLLKDLTAMGVGRIWFVQTELTDKSYRAGSLWKEENYRKFLIEGAVQAGETRLPEIAVPYSLKAALEKLPPEEPRFVFDNRPGAASFRRQSAFSLPATAAVGSERGWTDSERRLFADYGFSVYALGRRILRTETAAAAAAALVLERGGCW